MPYALIIQNTVYELFTQPPEFHPDLEIVQVGDHVKIYDKRNADGVFVSKPHGEPAFPDAEYEEVKRLQTKA